MVYFKILTRHLPGENEENHEKPWSGLLAAWLILEPGTFKKQF
jgi:hypothetical protein